MILTYKYRIKDSSTKKHLQKFSQSVNTVWNYCNEIGLLVWRKEKRFVTEYELNNLTSGSSEELDLHSQTIQSITREYVTSRRISKKVKLNWRTSKRQLNWIPLKSSGMKVEEESIRYRKKHFRFWNSRELPVEKIKEGSFSQDSLGRYYINLQCETPELDSSSTESLGIDLGLKDHLTLSTGEKFSRENLTKKYEKRLANLQRKKKQKRVKKLHTKIKNIRKDFTHKITTKIVQGSKRIFVGNVSSTEIIQKKKYLSKSVYDSNWSTLKNYLIYKAKKLGSSCTLVEEHYTTQDCSVCFSRTGPTSLGIRNWSCSHCKTEHDRDINSARNILFKGLSSGH
jgi:IS605 OrfB family transposase